MSSLKGDIINAAYSRARISGLTTQPTPEDLETALDRLEDMAAMWGEKICTGYFFEDEPDPNTPHGLKRSYLTAFKSNLAINLLSDFGKTPHPTLVSEASGSLSSLFSACATTRQVNYPSRMPVGGGNQLRTRWKNFFPDVQEAPIECETQRMAEGDISDYVESFNSYLRQDETLDSYTITADSGLTILSSSLESPNVLYRIEADEKDSTSGMKTFEVTIVGTSSTGRVETRVIIFEVLY